MSYCPIHGHFDDYSKRGCRECQFAEAELKSEVSHAAYLSTNPGDYDCPHCRYRSLKAAASRCPLCHGKIGSDYWDAETKRQEAREAGAVVAEQAAAVAKRAALAAERVTFDRATWGIRGRLLAFAFVVAMLWWGLRQYSLWLPDVHPQWVGATLAVLSEYVGVTLGATMLFIGFAFVVPRISREGIAGVAFFFLFALELSQLYQANWIDEIRSTWLGGLVLGHGFQWWHLLCYIIGVMPLAEDAEDFLEEVVAFLRLLFTLLCSAALIAFWQFLLEMW